MDEAGSKSVRHGFGETRPEDIKPYQASGGAASS
jgi:hypothetical protein